jgi:ligand-binding sensor domain-containing protein/serine phosphatase RsbU (regulator of sigma subunit)
MTYRTLKQFAGIVIACFLSIATAAQTYFFENYSVKEGLGQSNVHDIFQDEDGYIWLGTNAGASKFDGHTFINYTSEDGIAENGVRTIFKDKRGHLWLGHNGGGISRYNGKKLSMYLVLAGGDITKILEDRQGNVWCISSSEGALKISNPENENGNESKYQYYKGQEGLSDRVYGMLLDNEEKLCFITDVGIKYYNEKSDAFDFLKIEGMTNYFQTTYAFQAANDDLWIGTQNGGVKQYKAKTKEWRNYGMLEDGLASNFVSTIGEDNKGNVWVGTWGGGISIISPSGKIRNFNSGNGLKDNKIRKIYEDREGNMLIGTNENGIFIYKGDQFVSFSEKNGLVNEQVWTVLKDSKGLIWFGTNEGISVYDPHAELGSWALTYNVASGLPHNQIRFIKEDEFQNIWVGTWGGGVVKIPSAGNQPVYDFGINYQINQGFVTALAIDDKNDIWAGTIDGLVHYNVRSGEATRITQTTNEEGKKDGLKGNDISAVFVDNGNNIWVGSQGKGITVVSRGEMRYDFQQIDIQKKITASTFFQDAERVIWIGTEGHGIYRYENGQITGQMTTKDGLLSDYISTIDQDADGNMWIGSNIGLTRYNATNKSFRHYSQEEGFIGVEVKPNSSYNDNNGGIWYGTVLGGALNTVAEERINNLEPVTHITGFKINLKESPMTKGLELSYKNKDIRFDFSSICLSNPNAVRYKYMLEGADTEWRPITDQASARYSTLPPGEYTFKLVGINNSGVENGKPIEYSFIITPPFWQTIWFYATCGISLLIIVFLFIKIRERNLKKEKQILATKVEERTAEVVKQKEELSEKNKDIMDSIHYAERIQRAILPVEDKMQEHLTDVFVLFQPKDIVSGDFYWFHTDEKRIYFSAVDCTGHGVPGAFVSIIGNNGLNRAVNEYKLTKPSEILDKLSEFVEGVFKQQGNSDVKDGMDMALCALNPNGNETVHLDYAGANNGLYIITERAEIGVTSKVTTVEGSKLCLHEVKADRQPIGAIDGRKPYTNHKIELHKGESIYMFSDGYADQFGGIKGKKFKYSTLKNYLLEISEFPMQQQKGMLDDTIAEWMNANEGYEQIDDILVMGCRV